MPVKGEVKWSASFALTLTLNPKLYTLEPVIQRNLLQGILNTLSQDGSMKLTMFAELTQSQNIHAHGLVQVKLNGNKTVAFIFASLTRKYKDLGHWCIKPITDHDIWYKYCVKEQQQFLDNVGETSLLIDDLNLVTFGSI